MIVNQEPVWGRVISKSHGPLFNVNYLIKMGAYFREQYDDPETTRHDTWPDIPIKKCSFRQAKILHDHCAGFDLPLLFTPDNWNNEVVALVSQDPLRNPNRDSYTFTIATPWGFSNQAMKTKAGNTKILPTVEALVCLGYGVYFTDAAKLYMHYRNQGKWQETEMLEQEVLHNEIAALNPKLCIALGGNASLSLETCKVEHTRLAHPTARSEYLKKFYDTKTARHEEIGEAMKGRVLKLLER